MTSSATKDDPVLHCPENEALTESWEQRAWFQTLADVISLSDPSVESQMKMTMTCDIKADTPALYLPQDTDSLHPRCMRYIRNFAKTNGFRLGRDRRNRLVLPLTEQRDKKPPMIALGLSLLLKQTGLPGVARTLSKPHALAEGNEQLGLSRLIRMAALATPESKRVVVLPNRILINTLQDTQPICGFGCKLRYSGKLTILSHFESTYFRAIGYSTGGQYIVHICLAGGPRGQSSLWTQIPTLTNADFHFQLFPGPHFTDDFGLFYTTFYLNIENEPAPWWIAEQPVSDSRVSAEEASIEASIEAHLSDSRPDQPESQRKAS